MIAVGQGSYQGQSIVYLEIDGLDQEVVMSADGARALAAALVVIAERVSPIDSTRIPDGTSN